MILVQLFSVHSSSCLACPISTEPPFQLPILNVENEIWKDPHSFSTFILKNSPDGIIAGPLKEDNYFEWEAAITGPEGTVFEDGVFVSRLVFPQDYPLNPPTMR